MYSMRQSPPGEEKWCIFPRDKLHLAPIGMKICTMVELSPRHEFLHFLATLGVSKWGVKMVLFERLSTDAWPYGFHEWILFIAPT